MTSIRARLQPFYHISIPDDQISDGQRSFGMLGNDLFKDCNFLRDHPQVSLCRPKRPAHCFPSCDYTPRKHYSPVGLALIHPRNIPAHVAGVNWEISP